MKKVLCPIDFSDISLNTTAYAAKIAQISNAELVLFHEHSLWDNPEELVTGSAESTDAIAKELEERAIQISGAFHISCYADVISSAKPMISLLEKMSNEVDLIVMGIDQQTDLIKDIFGSLAFQLIRKVRIPMVLVPGNYTYQSIDKIMFAFDPYEKGETPIDQLVHWAGCWKSEIQLLEGLEEMNSERTSMAQKSPDTSGVVVHKIDLTNLIEEIQSFMIEGKLNMLALFARDRKFVQRLFHRSLIRQLEYTSTVPLFIFHE